MIINKNKGQLIELSRKFVMTSLSCEEIVKIRVNQNKMLDLFDEKKKEKYKLMKPDLFQEIDNIVSGID